MVSHRSVGMNTSDALCRIRCSQSPHPTVWSLLQKTNQPYPPPVREIAVSTSARLKNGSADTLTQIPSARG